MSYNDYVKQLEQVNEAIQSASGEQLEELISLKSSIEELLSLTGENDNEAINSQVTEEDDEEYALFLAEINGTSASNVELSENPNAIDIAELKALEGKKYRAPHTNKWGSKGYHNAMLCSILDFDEGFSNLKVKVLFINPTHEEMLPCPYYFDTDCKFSEDRCKYSHGEVVLFSELQDYVQPNFESLKVGSEVLAKQNNKLWVRAKITGIFESTCMVKFGNIKKETELAFDEILPLENENKVDDDTNDEHSDNDSVEIDQDVINMSLLNTPSTGVLGDWEKFTKGIGSKLMLKMGYIVGTGLGKKCEGRLDPVTAVILPVGKSLDHCMNLREKYGGDRNLFNAEERMKIHQRKQELHSQRAYEREQNKTDVFKFLNNTLTNQPTPSCSKSQHRRSIQNETCRDLNVASLKNDEEIRKTERDLYIIKESFSRHKDVNSQMHKSLKQKLDSTLVELSSLKEVAQNIQNEQNVRKDKKKLTIF